MIMVAKHLEDGAKRAKRMEHHEDDDGDVLMELACTRRLRRTL